MKNCFFVLFFVFPFLSSAQIVDSIAIKTVDSLIQVSRTLTGERDFEKALEVNAAAEELVLEKLGRESAAYGSCCFNQGRILYFKGNLSDAEKWYLKSLDIWEITLGKEHINYANSINNLAILYRDKGQHRKAEPLYLEAKDIRERTLGKEHPDYAASLNNLGNLYWDMGQYENAETFLLKAKAILGNALGKEHPTYSSCLNNLAVLYAQIGQYEKAELLRHETIAIREKSLGKEHPDYAWSLYGLAHLYREMGQYEKAEPLHLEAKVTLKKTSGNEHPDYALSMHGLAILYRDMGQYEKAELLYLEAKAIREKSLGKEHPDYIQSLLSLALLYSDLGNYEKAKLLYTEANNFYEKILGNDHPKYAKSLSNLATLYWQMGQYEKAETLIFEAKAIIEKTLGTNHPEYAACLNTLASIYWKKSNYEKAKSLYLEAKSIRERALGKEHPEYAQSLNNLAALFAEIGQYEKAESHFLQTKAIWEKVYGKVHQRCAENLINLTRIYWKMSDYEKAENFNTELYYLNKALLQKALTFLSERELNEYQKKFSDIKDQLLSFSQLSESKRAVTTCYDNSLFYKGFLLNAKAQVNRMAQGDPIATERLNLLKSYHRRLASLEALLTTERDSALIADLETKANNLEKDLVRTVTGYGEAMRQVNWEDVQGAFKPNEAAVEFVRFHYWNKKQTDSILYAALVLRPKDVAPHYVYLCTEAQLKTVLDRWDDDNVEISPAEVYYSKEGEPSLYELLWQPLESLLPKGMTVWYAPDGLLHRLNLDAVSRGKGQALGDDYFIHRVGSTRQLVLKDNSTPHGREAALFGGLHYESDTLAIEKSLHEQGIASRTRSIEERRPASPEDDTSFRDDGIDYLDNSLTEVQGISKSLQSAGYNPCTFTAFGGTEEVFLSLAGSKEKKSPRILHLATHGYFFPDPKENTTHLQRFSMMERNIPYRASDNPLIRSGILLSGCDQAWRTGKPASEKLADGILTAADIATMDLSNTELAVLSACQTGLGDIESNEGVYGLQRAFKIAGARNLIMSLWKVDDKVTMKLMTSFYAKWLDKKKPLSIPEAFKAAQTELRKEFPDPFFWAGFVLIE